MTWSDWISEGIGNWAKKALSALGLGWLSFEGFTAAFDALTGHIAAAWGAVGADVAAFLALTGIGEAFGIMLGGISGMLVLMAFKRLGAVQQ